MKIKPKTYDNILYKASEAANEFLDSARKLYGKRVLSTDEIISLAEKKFKVSFCIESASFKTLNYPVCNAGALMKRRSDNKFDVLINSDKPLPFQRFSILHAIGHIAANCFVNDFHEKACYTVCSDIAYVLPDNLADTANEEGEAIANIFALKIMIPMDLLIEQLKNKKSIYEMSPYFITEPDAIIARVSIGDVV